MKSKLFVVFGGQYGSEGKGQIAQFLHSRIKFGTAVRVGGPNAGHTFHYANGKKEVVQSIPVPAMSGALGVIGAAGVLIPELLLAELQRGYEYMNEPVQLWVDDLAAIITPEHMAAESELKKSIGSTGEGVGAATAEKVMRRAVTALEFGLEKWLIDRSDSAVEVALTSRTGLLLNQMLLNSEMMLIEGTQGYGLSLHTSGFYPFCTSRECTPQALYAETGINPANADQVEVVMVVRTFPIRVGGNSGPLANEITWEQLGGMTGGYVRTPEITTVTKKIRRIAKVDFGLIQEAVLQCRPTAVALTFFDYLHPDAAGIVDPSGLEKHHWQTIQKWEEKIGVPIKFLSTGLNCTMSLRVTI